MTRGSATVSMRNMYESVNKLQKVVEVCVCTLYLQGYYKRTLSDKKEEAKHYIYTRLCMLARIIYTFPGMEACIIPLNHTRLLYMNRVCYPLCTVYFLESCMFFLMQFIIVFVCAKDPAALGDNVFSLTLTHSLSTLCFQEEENELLEYIF